MSLEAIYFRKQSVKEKKGLHSLQDVQNRFEWVTMFPLSCSSLYPAGFSVLAEYASHHADVKIILGASFLFLDVSKMLYWAYLFS